MRAFEGIKVLDFTQVLAGPVATQMFSLLGANVVKIEAPGKGDQLRSTLSDPEMIAKRLSPAFLTVNLNKRSLAIDLKSEEGREIVYRLLEDADVVVENFSPGVAKRLGVDYEALKARKSDIVYCSISGYGQKGPRSNDKAYDSAIQAAAGIFMLNGHEETGPTRIGIMAIDMFTGINAAFAISSALFRRERTGVGQYLDVAMYDSALMLAGPQMSDFMVRGNVPPLIGNQSPTRQPTSGVYDTKDGKKILLAVLTSEHNDIVFRAIGLGHLLEDPRFATPDARRDNLKEGIELVGATMKQKTLAEWLELMGKIGIAAQSVRTLAEATSDDQLEHRGIIVEAEGIAGFDDAMRLVGIPFIANEDSPINRAHPPAEIGEHTGEVLKELGFGDDEIGKILALNKA